MSSTRNRILATAAMAVALLGSPAIGPAAAQAPAESRVVADQGVLRYADTGEEAAFFGVNYSPMFAHGHRALRLLGMDHREVIDQDVYHLARLGLNAFRIHVWDTEISDSAGNLIRNDHLDLLDYTLWRLSERGVRAIVTPLTFYNNAYPDGATPTPGFQNQISKGQAPQPEHRPLLKRYLDQFVRHVNPYTGLSYAADPNIIGLEIVNEPSHGADTTAIVAYIDELAAQIRESGWSKPVYYNISQSPRAAPAVLLSSVEGVSFQWYPAGLVGGKEIEVNYLPFIDRYEPPYAGDPAFASRSLMVYEFDAADVAHSYAYPAMARSFREAGFQWATQFAYDPIGFAFANSDYPTHFLNLAYTPGKGIGMMIAAEAFRRLPRGESYGGFPADTLFGDFRVSHARDLAEMNSTAAFFHTNRTETRPRDVAALERVAGVGSSPIVSYPGSGAYFLDRLAPGVWRLEVLPDAIPVRDPFERPAFDKHVTYIAWREHELSIALPDLGARFQVRGLNAGNELNLRADGGTFSVAPGSYLLVREGVSDAGWTPESRHGWIRLGEFAAPAPTVAPPVLRYTPPLAVDAGHPARVSVIVGGLAPADSVWLVASATAGGSSRVALTETGPGLFEGEIPASFVRPGFLRYWIVVGRAEGPITFPGGHPGLPNSWNYHHPERWETAVAAESDPIDLFRAARDHDRVLLSGSQGRQLVGTGEPGSLAIRLTTPELPAADGAFGLSFVTGRRAAGRAAALPGVADLVLRARSGGDRELEVKVVLIDSHANAFSATTTLIGDRSDHRIPLSAFRRDAFMLLPRPYPGFLPFWFRSGDETSPLALERIEQVQILVASGHPAPGAVGPFVLDVEAVWLDR